MALTFPLSAWLQTVPLRDGYFVPMWRTEQSRDASGLTIVKELGPMLWRAQYETVPLREDAALELETDLLSLQAGIELFEGYDRRRPFPKSDSVSALAGVFISAVSADLRSLKLAGLPAGFVLSKGDGLSVNDGTNLHYMRALEGATADAGGVTGFFAVMPSVHPSIGAGQPVVLRYPCARFALDPASVDPVRLVDEAHRVVSFSALQALE